MSAALMSLVTWQLLSPMSKVHSRSPVKRSTAYTESPTSLEPLPEANTAIHCSVPPTLVRITDGLERVTPMLESVKRHSRVGPTTPPDGVVLVTSSANTPVPPLPSPETSAV